MTPLMIRGAIVCLASRPLHVEPFAPPFTPRLSMNYYVLFASSGPEWVPPSRGIPLDVMPRKRYAPEPFPLDVLASMTYAAAAVGIVPTIEKALCRSLPNTV